MVAIERNLDPPNTRIATDASSMGDTTLFI